MENGAMKVEEYIELVRSRLDEMVPRSGDVVAEELHSLGNELEDGDLVSAIRGYLGCLEADYGLYTEGKRSVDVDEIRKLLAIYDEEREIKKEATL